MKNLILLFLLTFLLQNQPVIGQTKSLKNSAVFWDSLQKLCGMAFAGKVVHAPQTDTTFRGKKLVMHVRGCEKNRIRIPLFVGKDRSRTWVLTKIETRIRLKHDHRHKDGKPDKITMYGGTASSSGSATRQVFPADEETIDLLPRTVSNVWWIDLVPGRHFTYNLRQLGTNRFYSIEFDLEKKIPTPGPPWGWKK